MMISLLKATQLSLLLPVAKAAVVPSLGRRRYHGNSLSITRALQQDEGLLGDDVEEPVLLPQKPWGDDACPCMSREELDQDYGEVNLEEITIDHSNSTATVNNTATTARGEDTDSGSTTLYGLGCAPHDLNGARCPYIDDCTTVFPVPKDCDNSWCQRSWCYISRDNCGVQYSQAFDPETSRTLYYSYATCGHLDAHTHVDRVQTLQNMRLRAGFNSNTGGWMGSYNPKGSFAINREWYGPLVEFIEDAAFDGNFTLVQTVPPYWLAQESVHFWGSSSFDFCVYAVALGYLDICIGALTITPQRASITPFFEVTSKPIYLVTFLQEDSKSGWEEFVQQVRIIYQPFDDKAWLFIFLFCIPSLGLLMLYQEHGSPGTAFPRTQDYQVRTATGEAKVETRPSPMWKQSLKAIYIALLGLIVRGYRVRVFTIGGKFQLLAIMAFILLTTTVYTANLAAQFVTDAQVSPIDTLEEALKEGYNFCAGRKTGTTVMDLYNIDSDRLVVDPISEGGDGKPGFDCPKCAASRRAIDFMKQNHDDPSLYCDAAFINEEELQVFQQYGLHCNKTIVGEVLAFSHSGFALNTKIATAMTAHLYDLKYNGDLSHRFLEARPKSTCKPHTSQGGQKKQRLTIGELTGIWIAVYTLAFAGLIAKALESLREPHLKENKLKWVDQWGNALPNPKAVEALEGEDSAKPINVRPETAVMDPTVRKSLLPQVEDDLDESE